jgi:hypothetical protein
VHLILMINVAKYEIILLRIFRDTSPMKICVTTNACFLIFCFSFCVTSARSILLQTLATCVNSYMFNDDMSMAWLGVSEVWSRNGNMVCKFRNVQTCTGHTSLQTSTRTFKMQKFADSVGEKNVLLK